MPADTLDAALEHEHREIDASLEQFSEGLNHGEWRTGPLSAGALALRRHIYLEEEFLFPALRAAGFMAPVFVMLREHGQIWTRLDDIERAAVEAADPGAAQQTYRELAALLEAHNVKEEQILYPQADSVLEPAAHQRLSEFLERGQLPDGWVCEGAR
jgi:iron-sulfur cluster repair protein YtfE (RIC family)